MDRKLPDEARWQIIERARTTPEVCGAHGLRMRQSLIIQLHLELDDALPLRQAHQIALAVEARIRERYPDSDNLIHQDPVSLGREATDT